MISPSISIFSSFSAMTPPFGSYEERGPRSSRRPRASPEALGDQGDVRRLGAFRTFALLELNTRTLGKGLEALSSDVAVMDEEILRSLVGGDETVPLRIVEPLDGSASHKKHLPYYSRTRMEGARRKPDSL